MADSPAFFLSDLKSYVPFSSALARAHKSYFGALIFLFRVLFSQRPPWTHLRKAIRKKPDSPLREWYWSQTPYALGSLEVKYALRPELELVPKSVKSRSRDRLREAIVEQLLKGPARFDFLVQARTDPATMPLEDASVEWDESRAPFEKVASLWIPMQNCDFREMWDFAEDLSFTPWHTRVEHRPLGEINLARRRIYDALSARRHECNGRERREPEVSDVPVPG